MGWEEPAEDTELDNLLKPADIPHSAEQFHAQCPAVAAKTASTPNTTINLISDDVPTTQTEPSTSAGHTRSMVEQLEKLRGQTVNPSVPVCNNMPAGAEDCAELCEDTPVPVCDKQPIPQPTRRITPIPVVPTAEGSKKGIKTALLDQWGNNVVLEPVSGADQAAEDNVGNISTTISTSSANRPTIGQTSVSTTEQAQIREEVRSELRKLFPGIRHSALQQPETVEQKFPELAQPLEPIAIAGSEVSVADSQPKTGAVDGQSAFSRMMSGKGAGPSTQSFPNVMWRPKEPPCYFGKSTEDVHTWTSLVRRYLTFMGGSDAQQVAYAVTLLRDAAHEWMAAYEKRYRCLPRDWPQLSAALLERFGSNTRAQEAQSQLMAISQGNRPVREYASQFEMLLGRLNSYDEGLMLNQFVWGL